jgi:hypothetical protein
LYSLPAMVSIFSDLKSLATKNTKREAEYKGWTFVAFVARLLLAPDWQGV